MNSLFFIGIFVGSLITFILTRIFKDSVKNNNSNRDENKYRKGLYTTGYTYEHNNTKDSFSVTYEVYCLESSKTKTKIKILSSFSTYDRFSQVQDELEKRVNLSWVDTSTIEFIEKALDLEREEKIDKLLK